MNPSGEYITAQPISIYSRAQPSWEACHQSALDRRGREHQRMNVQMPSMTTISGRAVRSLNYPCQPSDVETFSVTHHRTDIHQPPAAFHGTSFLARPGP